MTTNQTSRLHAPFVENGKRIKRARRRLGMSQEALAAQVGITRRHVIRLENGEHLPSAELRDRIIEATGQPDSGIESFDDDEDSEQMPHRSLSEDLQTLAALAALLERDPDVIDDLLARA